MHWKIIRKAPRSERIHQYSRRSRFRPTLEVLEDRRLLSITSSLFVVDQTASSLTLSGDVGGFPLQQQGDGSLTSSYSGTIVADWDLGGLTINFDQPGTALNATATGNWQPKPDGTPGSAPADYGGKITVLFLTAQIALRNLTVAASTANPLPLSGNGLYNFPSTETLTVLWGEADYNAGPIGSGSKNLSTLSAQNVSPNAGTFEDLGNGSYRLTLPVSLTIAQTIDNLPATLHIDGQIMATAVLPVVILSDGTSANFDYSTSAVGGGGPVAIEDPAAAVIYTPQANLSSMTVTLTNHSDDTAEFLGYDLDDSGLTTTGYDPASGQLVITGSADPSVYQSVLRTITYENDSPTPDTSDRQIQFVISDGTNTSVVRTTTVHVSAPAAPSGPSGLLAAKRSLPSGSPIAIPGSNAVVLTSTDLVRSSLSLDVKVAAEDLAITLVAISQTAGLKRTAFRVSDGESSIPLDKLLALEAWPME